MKHLKKSILIFFIALLILFFGYLRDFIFKKINSLLQAWDHNISYDMPSFFAFLQNWEYNSVVNFKWILTFIFWGIYLVISIITVKLFFDKKLYFLITIAVYTGVLIISGMFICTGFIFSSKAYKMYEFARYLMGMAQSPIILMILIPVFKLYEKGNKQ